MTHARDLAGLDERVNRRALGSAEEAVQIVIDTGYGFEPIGRDADEAWKDDFEFPEDGSFDLFVWTGRAKRAVFHGRVLDDACPLLERFGAMAPDDCEPGEVRALTIDYVRVDPQFRGRGYAVRLVDAAVYAFMHRRDWVYADCYSQLIYKNLKLVLGAPFVAVPAVEFDTDEEALYQPSDAVILAHLDEHPIEGPTRYKSGFTLANRRHVHVLWKR